MEACSSEHKLAMQLGFYEGVNPQSLSLRDDESDGFISYATLSDRVDEWALRLCGAKSLVFIFIPNNIDGVASLLGAWKAGHAVALLDPNLSSVMRAKLIELYQPEFVIASNGDELALQSGKGGGQIHSNLALLLSTSGSTGSPKFVRLTAESIASNAKAIAEVLDIRPNEVGCGHLPLHYSYGLSVLMSHFACGAPVLLTERGFTDKAFWPLLREAQVAHMPGVPFHFQMMQRLRYERLNLPALRVLTQAGGALDVEARKAAHTFMEARGGRFHVMYGQTEAAPRMTTLSHLDFVDFPHSVGTALPGGHLEIVDEIGKPVPVGNEGMVIYRGPNIMWGYAENRSDLELSDVLNGRLETGDIGRIDDAGRLTITGRAKRFGKIYGLRVNLDEIERFVNALGHLAAVTQKGDVIYVILADGDGADDELLVALISQYTIPRTAYNILHIDDIPHTERGKIDYHALESLL
jgi:acyl-coenzyme A synthetase/AMP-(fatty) acid ligase